MSIKGRALVMGDNVNTDVLHPSQFFSLDSDRVRAGFLQAAQGYEGLGRSNLSDRIVVAGENFGCGSSRETGARAFLLAGVRAIVARSLAHIFSRNVRNLGLVAVECPDLYSLPEQGSEVEINLEDYKLIISATGRSFSINRLDPYWEAIMKSGGLMRFLHYAE
jgi:3-isopropylmalate dehydratase small subunit